MVLCDICKGCGWVCADHLDRPWATVSSRTDACSGGDSGGVACVCLRDVNGELTTAGILTVLDRVDMTEEELGPRECKSAEEIEDLLNESLGPVDGLHDIKVSVRRLPVHDETGSNWMPMHPPLPLDRPQAARESLAAVIASAKRHFNLWDVH